MAVNGRESVAKATPGRVRLRHVSAGVALTNIIFGFNDYGPDLWGLRIFTVQSKSVFLRLQKAAFSAGASTLALACLGAAAAFLPGSASAQEVYYYHQRPAYSYAGDGYGYPAYGRRVDPFPQPTGRRAARPSATKSSTAPARETKAAQEAPTPKGPHVLVVSLKSQRATLYANGKRIMDTPISSGMASHPTPTGIFSVIQKNRHHRSNIYSGAPMPYMQRLTWSGIALHEGALPGRPASHGCVRLPEKLANFLWRTTRLGARVVISPSDIEPYDVNHASLFQPQSATPATVETSPSLRRTLDTTTTPLTRTAEMTPGAAGAQVKSDAAPAAAAAETNGQAVAEPAATEAAAEKPASDVSAFATSENAKPADAADQATGAASVAADIPDTILDGFVRSLDAKEKKPAPRGPISVFISRKDKQLYVRQNFVPLFTAPVSIRDEQTAIGNHVLTAYDKDDGEQGLRWVAVTLPPESAQPQKTSGSHNGLQIDSSVRIDTPVRETSRFAADPKKQPVAGVLDRIEIAQDVRDRIAEYITAGASLILSDHGLGQETGLHTDFIVVTR